MAKKSIPADEKFEKVELDLFEQLKALDSKDYGYYDRLTEDQKKHFVPFNLIQWFSAVTGRKDVQQYYLQSTEYHANKYMFNYMIATKDHFHPKLQWLMLCAASPSIGNQYHQWIPKISERVSLFEELAKPADIQKYFKKVYPKLTEKDLTEISSEYVKVQRKKVAIGKMFPTLKIDEIELLSGLITDDELDQYERDSGN